ncbi:MAG: ATP-dependent helicase, partial [Sciscionella sp.]
MSGSLSLPDTRPDTPPGTKPDTDAEPGRRRTPSPTELLAGLNPAQRAAVSYDGPALLVIAGAGSGKTRVLTRRIAWLLAERHAHPGSILAITFTNKAAGEMRERVIHLVGGRAKLMWVSTFHSSCVRILRKEATQLGFTSTFSIYDDADSRRLMGLVIRDLGLDVKQHQPRAVLGWVSNAKNALRTPEDVAGGVTNRTERTYAECYTLYQQRLRQANALDFDDLIMMTVRLFQSHPEIRAAYRRRFRHVLVDEYQDTNHAQYVLVRELCAATEPRRTVDGDLVAGPASAAAADASWVEPAELMVVGDADQSIYAFRGANIRNILAFEEDFPAAATILLEQNYRSTQKILTAANSVISHNTSRKPKNLWADAGNGEDVIG